MGFGGVVQVNPDEVGPEEAGVVKDLDVIHWLMEEDRASPLVVDRSPSARAPCSSAVMRSIPTSGRSDNAMPSVTSASSEASRPFRS